MKKGKIKKNEHSLPNQVEVAISIAHTTLSTLENRIHNYKNGKINQLIFLEALHEAMVCNFLLGAQDQKKRKKS